MVIAPISLQPVTQEPAVFVEEDMAVPVSERVTIMDLRESMCRWPMGDPTKPEFRFCGARSITGLPYCTITPASPTSRSPTASAIVNSPAA